MPGRSTPVEDAKGGWALNNRVCSDHVSMFHEMTPTKKKSWAIEFSKTNRDILRAGEMKLQKQRARGFTLQVERWWSPERNELSRAQR